MTSAPAPAPAPHRAPAISEQGALAALAALANPIRLALVRMLVGTPEGISAGDLSRRLGISASGLSFHLAALEQARIVCSQRRSRHVIYAADRATLGAVIAYLLDDCCCADPVIHACCRAGKADPL